MTRIEAGIPLLEDELGDALDGGIVCWFKARVDQEPTHRAYPVEYAVALEAVAEAVRDNIDYCDRKYVVDALRAALDALAAAGGQQPPEGDGEWMRGVG